MPKKTTKAAAKPETESKPVKAPKAPKATKSDAPVKASTMSFDRSL